MSHIGTFLVLLIFHNNLHCKYLCNLSFYGMGYALYKLY
jgi:hypothetical protein